MRGGSPSAHLAAITILLSLAASPTRSADYEQQHANGQATLRLTGDRVQADIVEMALSTKARLTIAVEGQAPLRVDNEEAIVESETVAIGEVWNFTRSVKREAVANGRERWILAYELDPKAEARKKYPIDYVLTLVPVTYRDGTGAAHTAAWRPFTVRITTRVENPDNASASQLHDITGIEETPEAASRRWWITALAVAGGALLASAALVGLWRLMGRTWTSTASLNPEQWALRELERIETQRLPTANQAERYYTLLSDVVRRYLELRFRLRAPQQTTAEFLSAMQSWPLLPGAQQAQLREFLERCDLVKFARVTPTPEECRATGAMARALVRAAPLTPTAAS